MWGKAYKSGLKFGGFADVDWLLKSFRPEMKVLEIGCGDGKTYIALRKHGIAVIGVDIAAEALEILYRNAETIGIEPIVEHGDARNLRFGDSCFDAVIAIHLLDALETDADRAAVVSEVFRILRARGQFLCEVFCTEDFRNGRGKKVSNGTYVRGHVPTTYFDEEKLMALFSNKFEVEIWHHRVQKSYGTRCSLRAKCVKKI